MSGGPVIKLDRVTKRYGDFTAVDNASLTIEPGAIHAIIGENGAGKSTLLKLAAGAVAPTQGDVFIDGAILSPATPIEATRRGVGMVHQHFMLVGAFTALENLVLGSEPMKSGGRVDWAAASAKAGEIMRRAGLTVPLEALTDDLTVGERQRLEILRVLYRGARAILLDEPTAVLSPLEADELYAMLRRLADEGNTVVVVTHRLDEVVRFADRVTVMRRGRVVEVPEASGDEGGAVPSASLLTAAIMGGEPPPAFKPPALAETSPVVLEIMGLSLTDAAGARLLDDINLEVRGGEIVGVAGIEGNGQRELVRAIAGLEPRASGSIRVGGRSLAGASSSVAVAARARRSSVGVVHEDRQIDGLLLDASVGDNIVLGDLGDPILDADPGGEPGVIQRRIDSFQVRPPNPSALARDLSGGNQQKIVVARALDRITKQSSKAAAVLAQPTRGVDVGAAAVIHEAIGAAAAAGLAVVVISADLAELRTLSHRIVVMRRGRIVAELPPDADVSEIGRMMLGKEAA